MTTINDDKVSKIEIKLGAVTFYKKYFTDRSKK